MFTFRPTAGLIIPSSSISTLVVECELTKIDIVSNEVEIASDMIQPRTQLTREHLDPVRIDRCRPHVTGQAKRTWMGKMAPVLTKGI